MLNKIYGYADLDLNMVNKIRLPNKKVITKKGTHEAVHDKQIGDVMWYDKENFDQYFQPDINENQIKRLNEAQKQIILLHANKTLKYFNYLTN